MDLQRGFRIGPWTVHPRTGEISSGSNSARLEPKVMDVLVVLAGEAPEVVLRDDLLERVWGARAEIADEPLTRCIAQLRRAFGDSARDSEYFQTIPRRGYRLLKPVTPLDQQAPSAAAGDSGDRSIQVPLFRRRGVIAGGGAVAVLGFGAATLWNLDRLSDRSGSGGDLDSVANPVSDIETAYEPNPVAVNMLNQAQAMIEERSFETLEEAVGKLQQAIDVDKEFAEAYIEYAFVAVLLPYYASTRDEASKRFAQEQFEEAGTKLYDGVSRTSDEDLMARAQGIRAFIDHVNWQWQEAATGFRQALDRSQSDDADLNRRYAADLHHRYSSFLSDTGQLEDARMHAETATQLDKDSGVFLERLVVIDMWRGEYVSAWAEFESFLKKSEKEPNPDALLVLLYCSQQFDRLEEQLSANFAASDARIGWVSPFIAALKSTDNQDPIKDAAVAKINEAIDANALEDKFEFGAWVFLEQWDKAIAKAIEMARDEQLRDQLEIDLLFSKVGRGLRMHDETRFQELLAVIGLDRYFDANGWPTEYCDRSSGGDVVCTG